MTSVFINASARQTGMVELKKCYSKMQPTMVMDPHFLTSSNVQEYDEQSTMVSIKVKLNKQKKKAWRIKLRRFGMKVTALKKQLRGGVHGSRAILFRGATSTAANLVKSTSFFCHFNQRFHLMFLSASRLPRLPDGSS